MVAPNVVPVHDGPLHVLLELAGVVHEHLGRLLVEGVVRVGVQEQVLRAEGEEGTGEMSLSSEGRDNRRLTWVTPCYTSSWRQKGRGQGEGKAVSDVGRAGSHQHLPAFEGLLSRAEPTWEKMATNLHKK